MGKPTQRIKVRLPSPMVAMIGRFADQNYCSDVRGLESPLRIAMNFLRIVQGPNARCRDPEPPFRPERYRQAQSGENFATNQRKMQARADINKHRARL